MATLESSPQTHIFKLASGQCESFPGEPHAPWSGAAPSLWARKGGQTGQAKDEGKHLKAIGIVDEVSHAKLRTEPGDCFHLGSVSTAKGRSQADALLLGMDTQVRFWIWIHRSNRGPGPHVVRNSGCKAARGGDAAEHVGPMGLEALAERLGHKCIAIESGLRGSAASPPAASGVAQRGSRQRQSPGGRRPSEDR